MSEHRQPVALSWGVKQSFRRYVEMAGGSIETSGAVGRTDDGEFTFTASPGRELTLDANGAPQGRCAFAGEVRFQAHGGMLAVRLADPAVEIGPSGGVLTVADGQTGGRRVEIARLDVAAAASDAGELVIPAALSVEGIPVLGDHYPPMTPLDPVRLKLA